MNRESKVMDPAQAGPKQIHSDTPEEQDELVPVTQPLPVDRGDTGGGVGQGGGRRGGGRKKGKGGAKKARKAMRRAARRASEAAAVVQVQPIAQPARLKRRHWGLMFSFLVLVLAPLAGIIFYLWTYAEDQYISTTGFTVRSQESNSSTELLGGLNQFVGGSTASDSDILYEFIQSQEMVEAVNAKIDLRAHYSQPWPDDWAFSIWPEATTEDLLWYWHRIIGISYDSGTGLIEVTALAFDPETARAVASEILSQSQDRINVLNNQAREDALRYASDDLDEAVAELKAAREALTRFRTRTRIVDPDTDIQVRMGVMQNLQQQLATALVELDLLRVTSSENDPRLTKAQQHIDVISDRILKERETFAGENTDTGAVGEDYPTLIAEFESLTVDREYAEQVYTTALTALAEAKDNAARQSRYLATYIAPTQAQESEYPRRYVLSALAGLFLVLTWSILSLIYYSIRDRS